jgi:hypothetical protein
MIKGSLHMTSRIKAINHYRPRVKVSKTVETPRFDYAQRA